MLPEHIPLFLFVALTLASSLQSFVPPFVSLKREINQRPQFGPVDGPTREMRAQRVIIFPPLLAGYATLDQGVEHIEATSAGMTAQVAKEPISKVYPDLKRIRQVAVWPRGTTYPTDPEQVLLMRPDAVLVWQGTAFGIEHSGVPVFEIKSLSPEAGMHETWNLLGDLTEQHSRANWIEQRYEKTDYEIRRAVNEMKEKPERRVLMLWTNEPMVMNLASSTFPPAMDMEHLGAVNLADIHKVSRVNIEGLLALNPDIIFLNGIAEIEEEPETFYAQPILRSLIAVRDRQVYKLPATGSGMEGLIPDHELFLEWMTELLYPSHMPTHLRDMFKSNYWEVYHYVITDDQIDEAIFSKENSSSFGYDRFARSVVSRPAHESAPITDDQQ